jgi:uncharacterized DUF497 family protein
MSNLQIVFEFDSDKAASNLAKHGVSFREAMTVFDDPFADTFPDALHSQEEDRFITIGLSSRQRLLFLSHRESENRIRLIGARPATQTERNSYEELKART